MANFFVWAKKKVSVDTRLIATYCIVYVLWGMGMNWIGTALEIAKFENWWQVVTCYVLYMVPVSLLLRQLPFHTQYAYGLIAMAFLEFGGYYFGTSFAYPDNFVEQFFGIRNFAL
ncbi:MAG TPA: hypothetical protein VFM69_13350, partial [Pricia sp.]|nr:hypothetical protein [Pricia sp.]